MKCWILGLALLGIASGIGYPMITQVTVMNLTQPSPEIELIPIETRPTSNISEEAIMRRDHPLQEIFKADPVPGIPERVIAECEHQLREIFRVDRICIPMKICLILDEQICFEGQACFKPEQLCRLTR